LLQGEDQALSRWQELVDNLLTDLETETPGADDFRVNIDHKIWEAEQTLSYAVPMTRLHGFERELIETLSKQLKNDSGRGSMRRRYFRKCSAMYWMTFSISECVRSGRLLLAVAALPFCFGGQSNFSSASRVVLGAYM
jgi:hypothetical protein